MNRKLIGGQKPFRILVANLKGASDPSRGAAFNPVKQRIQFEMQFFPEIGGRGQDTTPASSRSKGASTRVGLVGYSVSPIPVRATGTITVTSNVFLGPTTVVLGKYELVSGYDFAIGGGAGTTAANLAAAIGTLPEFSASVLGAVISVEGLPGPLGNEVAFFSTGASPNNFSFSPVDRSMSGAEPRIGPPAIT